MMSYVMQFKTMVLTLAVVVVIILLCVMPVELFAQHSHDYPRLMMFNWGGATPEWYAKFDVVVTANNGTGFAQGIKNINPNTWVMPTRDINAGQCASPYYDQWTTLKSDGSEIRIYGGARPLADMSDFCPVIGGKRYSDAVIDYMSTFCDLSVFDGAATDGLWEFPDTWVSTDIDLDRNGVNDWNEHGRDWIRGYWLNGVNKVLQGWRDRNPNKLFFINSGGFHSFGWNTTNGMFLEFCWALTNWTHFNTLYQDWMKRALEPHVMFVDGTAKYRWDNKPTITKNDYQAMRFLLTTTLLGDGYFTFEDVHSEFHEYVKYYDEFDVKLGYPTHDAQRLQAEGPDWNIQAVWVRFFDNGASIVNAKGKTVTVTDAELRTLNGYAGPYYRFKGGQDPTHNNGEPFDQITLWGVYENPSLYKIMGDGIVLVKKPETIIADVIIDNVDAGTSAGSETVEYVGNWAIGNYGTAGSAWAMTNSTKDGFGAGYHYASSGNGNNYAVFRPTFGVAGSYKVYEWHAFHGAAGDDEAADVPYEIHHSNGTSTVTVNQRANYGKWNYLGTFSFSAGSNNYIKVSNTLNGIVIADAIRFEFPKEAIPPLPPTNLGSSDQTESSVTLAWTAPGPASDGDLASYYEIHRNGTFVRTTVNPTYIDTGLEEDTDYSYSVFSVDDAGNRSTTSADGGPYHTLADNTPPKALFASNTSSNVVEITFSEPMDESSAENVGNYSINSGISIYSANLVEPTKVNLGTSAHTAGVTYEVTISNLIDRAKARNVISPNPTILKYIGIPPEFTITISSDNEYHLFVNGDSIGRGDGWNDAETYVVPSVSGTNVIAVRAIDYDIQGGLVVEIDYMNNHFVSDRTWKVATSEPLNWKSVEYNDSGWSYATEIGRHGATQPWSDYGNVSGISQDRGVQWIWSADNENDNVVYFRFVYPRGDTPPSPPVGLQVRRP
ncbi:fibronectin type III domain-containing protein [candidate division KSB1 bacterium]|nr:fibronectin type III domain-containing protein [candidate division KSB1 bacterium]